MKLTDIASNLVIHENKIRKYLLNLEHDDGKPKADFLMRFGFAPEEWEQLRKALFEHAENNEVVGIEEGYYGMIHNIEGPLPSPDHRNPLMRAGWQIDFERSDARFITIYPMKGDWDDQ